MFPMQYDLLHKLEAKEKQDRAQQEQRARDARQKNRQTDTHTTK